MNQSSNEYEGFAYIGGDVPLQWQQPGHGHGSIETSMTTTSVEEPPLR